MATRASSRSAAREMPVLPGKLGAGTLPSQLHDILEDAIVGGLLEAGERLSADDLAQRYGVSRIPVREALSSLHEAGWVDIRPRYGVYVRRRSDQELTELFAVRAVIEAYVARCAAQRRTDAELTVLRDVVGRNRAAARRKDQAAMNRLGGQFYGALRVAAHNAVLAHTSEAMEKRARFYFSTVAARLGAGWVDVHEQLLEAVVVQDAARAESIAHEHIERTGEAVHALLAKDGRMDDESA